MKFSSDFSRASWFDRRGVAQDKPPGLPFDFVLVNPGTRTRIADAQTEAGHIIVEPDPVFVAGFEFQICERRRREIHAVPQFGKPQGSARRLPDDRPVSL